MRVVELQAYQIRIPLRKPFKHASYTRTSTDNLAVRWTLPSGATEEPIPASRLQPFGMAATSALVELPMPHPKSRTWRVEAGASSRAIRAFRSAKYASGSPDAPIAACTVAS